MRDEAAPNDAPAPDCWASKEATSPGATQSQDAGHRAERGASFGALLSAFIASSWCWLPPLLILGGISGAGMTTIMQDHRPLLMVVTFAFLGAAFYLTYRSRSTSAATAKAMVLNKVMLWTVTVMVVVFLFFGQQMTRLFMPDDERTITTDMTQTVIQIEGMTWHTWAPRAQAALESAPGVLAATVDFESRRATIGTERGGEVQREQILAALEAKGFNGVFLDEHAQSPEWQVAVIESFHREALLQRFDVDQNGKLGEQEKRALRGAFGDIDVPMLPKTPFDYTTLRLPAHVNRDALKRTDSTPAVNPITNEGASLGRVLFYDKQLSANNTVACASCHVQQDGFADRRQLSVGFEGGHTRRNAMNLANLRFSNIQGHEPGFFWDERAATLEDQALMPIQDAVEMGMTLPQVNKRIVELAYYPGLFEAAFGTPEVTSDRIAQALAQFMRSMVTMDAAFDREADKNGDYSEPFAAFTEQQNLGKSLFIEGVDGIAEHGCAHCHVPPTFSMTKSQNNGLAMRYKDRGLGALNLPANDPFTPSNDGKFKAPSLRNVERTAPYMHDGRFATLEQVIDHYSESVHLNENLMLAFAGQESAESPAGLKFTAEQKAALVAFLKTLTDQKFIADPKFSDPFVRINETER